MQLTQGLLGGFMKKFMGLFLMAAAFVLFSCASSQQEVDSAFNNVYNTYADALITTGASNYTVKEGDTLSDIARNYYGANNAYYFPLIMLASKDVVLDPDLIEPGMKLIIPDLQANTTNEKTKPRIKSYFKEIAEVYRKKGTSVAKKTRQALLKISESL